MRKTAAETAIIHHFIFVFIYIYIYILFIILPALRISHCFNFKIWYILKILVIKVYQWSGSFIGLWLWFWPHKCLRVVDGLKEDLRWAFQSLEEKKYAGLKLPCPRSHVITFSHVSGDIWVNRALQKPSLSKWGQQHKLSCENEFLLAWEWKITLST